MTEDLSTAWQNADDAEVFIGPHNMKGAEDYPTGLQVMMLKQVGRRLLKAMVENGDISEPNDDPTIVFRKETFDDEVFSLKGPGPAIKAIVHKYRKYIKVADPDLAVVSEALGRNYTMPGTPLAKPSSGIPMMEIPVIPGE